MPQPKTPERQELMARIKKDPLAYAKERLAHMKHSDVEALLSALSKTEGIGDEIDGDEDGRAPPLPWSARR